MNNIGGLFKPVSLYFHYRSFTYDVTGQQKMCALRWSKPVLAVVYISFTACPLTWGQVSSQADDNVDA